MKNGKRDAEKAVEKQAVGSKKQKIVNGGVDQAVGEKKFETKTQQNTKKEQTSSSEEHGSSQSEVEQNKENPEVASQPEKFPSGGFENGSVVVPAKKEQSDGSADISLKESGSDEEKVDVVPAKEFPATTQDAKRARSSNEEFKEENGDDSSKKRDDHQNPNTPDKCDTDVEIFDASSLRKTLSTPITSQATGPKVVFMGNLSFSIEEEDVKNFFKDAGEIAEVRFGMREDRFAGYAHVVFTTAEAAQEALKLNNEELLDRRVRLDLARERGAHPSTTPQAIGSKTLYLGNLSFSIEEDDVKNFFKDVGEVAEIRFAMRDERFMGYGHVEFTTAEVAQEALKLNNEILLDRPVKLDLARERGAYTPGSGKEKSNQVGGQSQGKTVFIRGFDTGYGYDNIRNALEKHFGKCGEISRMSIPKDYESGAPKGVAFIEFAENNGFRQALELNGSEVGGSTVTVEEAKKPRVDSREGSGNSGGRGFGGGWSGGSGFGGGWSGGSGFGGGWSGGSGRFGGGFSGSRGGWFSGSRGGRGRGPSRP